jgi:hypothetical protein
VTGNDAIAGAFNNLRRSLIVQRLAAIHLTEPLTAEEPGRRARAPARASRR